MPLKHDESRRMKAAVCFMTRPHAHAYALFFYVFEPSNTFCAPRKKCHFKKKTEGRIECLLNRMKATQVNCREETERGKRVPCCDPVPRAFAPRPTSM